MTGCTGEESSTTDTADKDRLRSCDEMIYFLTAPFLEYYTSKKLVSFLSFLDMVSENGNRILTGQSRLNVLIYLLSSGMHTKRGAMGPFLFYEFYQLALRHWLIEEIALDQVAVVFPQEIVLLLSLHSLCDYCRTQAMAHVYSRSDYGTGYPACFDLFDEA